MAKGDIGVNGNELIFEEEKNYFDDVLKEKNFHLKMNPQDQIIKLEGLARKTKSTDTAREYEKLKRDMIAKSEERDMVKNPYLAARIWKGVINPKPREAKNSQDREVSERNASVERILKLR